MIFIDFRIAFDTLEWNIFNFGSDLINWVRIFYQNIQNCVINNGLASEYFTLEQSVKQGDPCLPLYLGLGNLGNFNSRKF